MDQKRNEEEEEEEEEEDQDPIRTYLMLQKLVADPSELHMLGSTDSAFPVGQDYGKRDDTYDEYDEHDEYGEYEDASRFMSDDDDEEEDEDYGRFDQPRHRHRKDKHELELRRALQALSRGTAFAVGGALGLSRHDEMCVLLKIGQDELKSLLADVDYEKVVSLCVPSAFGNVATGQTLMDTKVRTGLEIDAEGRTDVAVPSARRVSLVIEHPAQVVADPVKDWAGFVRQTVNWAKHGYMDSFSFPHSKVKKTAEKMVAKIKSCPELAQLVECAWSLGSVYVNRKNPPSGPFSGKKYDHPVFLGRILHRLQESLLSGINFTLEPYKLMVYETGGHFKVHKDSPVKDMVATLLVALPSEHTGGVLEVKEKHGQSMEFDFSAKSGDKHSIQWCAFFSDCEHVLRPVESGRRVVLAYRILARPSTVEAVSKYPLEEDFQQGPSGVDAQNAVLERIVQNVRGSTGFVLRHEYGLLSLQPGMLKGMDRVLYEHLQKACKPEAQPRLYNILGHEEAEQDDYLRYPNKSHRRGRVYAVDLPEVRFQAGLSTVRPPPPVDKDVVFVRGEWVKSDVELLEEEVEGSGNVGNEASPGQYAYVYLQSAVVVKQEDLR